MFPLSHRVKDILENPKGCKYHTLYLSSISSSETHDHQQYFSRECSSEMAEAKNMWNSSIKLESWSFNRTTSIKSFPKWNLWCKCCFKLCIYGVKQRKLQEELTNIWFLKTHVSGDFTNPSIIKWSRDIQQKISTSVKPSYLLLCFEFCRASAWNMILFEFGG